jgi:hypothetical protein
VNIRLEKTVYNMSQLPTCSGRFLNISEGGWLVNLSVIVKCLNRVTEDSESNIFEGGLNPPNLPSNRLLIAKWSWDLEVGPLLYFQVSGLLRSRDAIISKPYIGLYAICTFRPTSIACLGSECLIQVLYHILKRQRFYHAGLVYFVYEFHCN